MRLCITSRGKVAWTVTWVDATYAVCSHLNGKEYNLWSYIHIMNKDDDIEKFTLKIKKMTIGHEFSFVVMENNGKSFIDDDVKSIQLNNQQMTTE